MPKVTHEIKTLAEAPGSVRLAIHNSPHADKMVPLLLLALLLVLLLEASCARSDRASSGLLVVNAAEYRNFCRRLSRYKRLNQFYTSKTHMVVATNTMTVRISGQAYMNAGAERHRYKRRIILQKSLSVPACERSRLLPVIRLRGGAESSDLRLHELENEEILLDREVQREGPEAAPEDIDMTTADRVQSSDRMFTGHTSLQHNFQGFTPRSLLQNSHGHDGGEIDTVDMQFASVDDDLYAEDDGGSENEAGDSQDLDEEGYEEDEEEDEAEEEEKEAEREEEHEALQLEKRGEALYRDAIALVKQYDLHGARAAQAQAEACILQSKQLGRAVAVRRKDRWRFKMALRFFF